jgi:hypothetical protein
VAGGLGYCGLDRARLPLSGDELRGCWQPLSRRPAFVAESPAVSLTSPGGFWTDEG